ncbi:hypothetical protein [Cellulomonas hominis]|jgi:hypothetical protein|uniref:Uncharacterized protein n=1 Tax=Cellulomonas hominis TaxID=156981 RepID=A0A7W8W9S3_9CELL|nr:hypothetical protein [Cellulomonas hominis]MBB5473660.1 hypothetical protein [Cellulomonas hominis]
MGADVDEVHVEPDVARLLRGVQSVDGSAVTTAAPSSVARA